MKLSYNFISLVAMGNFNPAILSSDFLQKVCELHLGQATPLTPPDMPVLRGLKFPEHEFLIDLERLSLKEIKIKDIHKTKVIEIFRAYYRNLPHTPLGAVGVNINCDFAVEEGNDIDSLSKRIKDPSTYLDFFGVDEIDITQRSLHRRDQKIFMASDLRVENVKSLTRLINIKKAGQNSFSVNYNCEASYLNQDISRLELLFEQYEEFCNEFLSFTKYLEG